MHQQSLIIALIEGLASYARNCNSSSAYVSYWLHGGKQVSHQYQLFLDELKLCLSGPQQHVLCVDHKPMGRQSGSYIICSGVLSIILKAGAKILMG